MQYQLEITDKEYARFKAHPATRLYVHTYIANTLTIETSKPRQLAADLEQVIDFGATSARDVLGALASARFWVPKARTIAP